ncbi:MAG: cobalamin-binding protein, partial [Spirochaetia bacterium]|nr:cobalamin-binding protein [Spirochaetia bacterium]
MANRTLLSPLDRIGLARPGVDAHTLGIFGVAQLLESCGFGVFIADAKVSEALNRPDIPDAISKVADWIILSKITVLGISYRLDPKDGADRVERLVHELKTRRLCADKGAQIKAIYFAGMPQTCLRVKQRVPEIADVFSGDETPAETLERMGVPTLLIPKSVEEGIRYDQMRMDFGHALIRRGSHEGVKPVDRSGYPEFGTTSDSVVHRIEHSIKNGLPPVMRAHVGPFLQDRAEAVKLFLEWSKTLAHSGFLDVLSIGSSQLTQSDFGGDWTGLPNGGGVPIHSADELEAVWKAARPMLVRTYAGTRNLKKMAEIHEKTIHQAWHALSIWWFCQLDGRGPYSVRENLQQQMEALDFIGTTHTPFEANVSHHFAFRGADDVSYIVSGVLSARTAKRRGVKSYVIQNMLNTPKATWGINDLAKSRALIKLIRSLEDKSFRVFLQPRGGLDYFSSDSVKAKAQLAAVTALMDDIEPDNPASPEIIHVVSYSEGMELADPPVVDESIRITRAALDEYRSLRKKGDVPDMAANPDVINRTAELLAEVQIVLEAIEKVIPDPYSAEGLYKILEMGFLPVPYLWNCREEFV